MSLLDGKCELDTGRGNRGNRDRDRNNNGGNNKKKDRQNQNQNHNDEPRSYDRVKDYKYLRSSYLNAEAREELMGEESTVEDAPVLKRDNRAEEIYDFIDSFKATVESFRDCRDMVIDKFPGVVKYVRSYYKTKNTPVFNDAINKLISIISTEKFANVLTNILEKGYWTDDSTYDKCWREIAFALSTALETSYERMHSSVVSRYAGKILPRMWGPEITDIVTETGVTRDLALDLIIAIPMVDAEWNSSNEEAFYGRFLDKMLIHAEDNMDVLNWEVQGMLYQKFFGNGKTALRIIGKYLTSEPRQTKSDVEQAVYQDFIKMLYSKLDAYDINDIAYVFRYVASTRKETGNVNTIFNAKQASAYDDVKKGLIKVLDEDASTMEFLA